MWARDFLLWLCQRLGIRVNLPKSSLVPKQTQDYLGITIETTPLRVFPTLKRIQKLSLLLQDFLSTRSHPVSVWRQLLGVMSSMSALVPGCVLFRSGSMWPVVSSRMISPWRGIPIATRIFCGGPTSLIFKLVCLSASLSPTCACSQTRWTPAGVPLSATSICQARGLPYPLGFPSITESFWQFC